MEATKIKMLINESDCISSKRCQELLWRADIEADLCCTDGIGLLNRINSVNYDLLLTDVFVPAIDAVRLKKLYDKRSCRPLKFYGLLQASNRDIETTIINANFSYYFIKPRDESIVASTIVEQLSRDRYGLNPFDKNDEIILAMLRNLNISSDHLGFHYAYYSVLLYIEYADVSLSITKIVYPMVAKKYNTTAGLVEKTIRASIESSWSLANPIYQSKYFGYSNQDDKKRPTNLQFISTLASNVQLQNRRVKRINFAMS